MFLWIIPVAVFLLIFIGVLAGYLASFYHEKKEMDPTLPPQDEQAKAIWQKLEPAIRVFQEQPYEEVCTTSKDGLRLSGKFYNWNGDAPLFIMCHGYKGCGDWDFSGSWDMVKRLGFNALIIDQRAHGKSQGKTITYGIREHLDLLCWIDYANNRFGNKPTFLMGVSMGAATVLMASGKSLPTNVKGIIADCPYDAPSTIIKYVIKHQMKAPVWVLYPLVYLGGLVFGGVNLNKYSPVEAVKDSEKPLLLIHGDDDRFVPSFMSENIKQNAPKGTRLQYIVGAGHALNQITDPDTYFQTLSAFVQEHLGKEQP